MPVAPIHTEGIASDGMGRADLRCRRRRQVAPAERNRRRGDGRRQPDRRAGARVFAVVWTALLALVAVDARGAMTPAETRDHIGEAVVVEGHLDSVVCSPQACLLSFEPGFSGLIVS